ncbi:hypothetical protein RYX36_029395 [Vicia faba]
MRFQSILLLLLVLLASATMNQALPRWTPVKDITNTHYLKMVHFAVNDYGNKTGQTLEFEKLINVEGQSYNDGTNFRLTLAAKNRLISHKYEAVVWEPGFGGAWVVTSFQRA